MTQTLVKQGPAGLTAVAAGPAAIVGAAAAAPTLPAGLVRHCDACQLVIPADAPAAPQGTANCASVAWGKLAWFNPDETRAGQHIMAAAAWVLIHDAALKQGHAASVEYRRRMTLDRKALYAQSAARGGMTAEEIAAESVHRRDRWLHAPDKPSQGSA